MNTYEIPDPFDTFVAHKYRDYKGMIYDFFAREWHLKAACCGEDLYAPNKKTMTKIRLYHTRNDLDLKERLLHIFNLLLPPLSA